MSLIFKTCGDCKKKLPKTLEYFNQQCKGKKNEYILKSVCKKCHLINNKRRMEIRKLNGTFKKQPYVYKPKIRTEKDKIKSKIYYENNKEYFKNYAIKNKKKLVEKNKMRSMRKKARKVLNEFLIKVKLEKLGFVSIEPLRKRKIKKNLERFFENKNVSL